MRWALAVSLALHLLAGGLLVSAFSSGKQVQGPQTGAGDVVFATWAPLKASPSTPLASAGPRAAPEKRQTQDLDKATSEPLIESAAWTPAPATAQGTPVAQAVQSDQEAQGAPSSQRFRWRGGRQAEDRDRMVQQSMRDGMSANQLEQLMSHLQSLPRDLRAGAPVECELSAAGLNCNAHGFAEQAMIAQLGAQIYRGNPGFRPIWLKRDSAGGWSATSQQNESP